LIYEPLSAVIAAAMPIISSTQITTQLDLDTVGPFPFLDQLQDIANRAARLGRDLPPPRVRSTLAGEVAGP
jgi:hypothetical protein